VLTSTVLSTPPPRVLSSFDAPGLLSSDSKQSPDCSVRKYRARNLVLLASGRALGYCTVLYCRLTGDTKRASAANLRRGDSVRHGCLEVYFDTVQLFCLRDDLTSI
jgi:hypothetical protein